MTPECDKLISFYNERMVLERFIEWLESENMGIGEYIPDFVFGRFATISISTEELLRKYVGIDSRKLEEERRAILEEQRKLNQKDFSSAT